jgi:hypothetical protein
MMDQVTIAAMSREAAEKAAAEGLYPFTVEEEDLKLWRAQVRQGEAPTFKFPVIGDLDPDGWEETGELFVDSLGWDLHDSGGPALSISELVNGALGAGRGYAIGDVGEFQLYIREFKRATAA